jgi:hypothetical protein
MFLATALLSTASTFITSGNLPYCKYSSKKVQYFGLIHNSIFGLVGTLHFSNSETRGTKKGRWWFPNFALLNRWQFSSIFASFIKRYFANMAFFAK